MRSSALVLIASLAALSGVRASAQLPHFKSRVAAVRVDALVTDGRRPVLQEFRQRYVLGYTPADVAERGWHTIEVKLRGKKGEVRARRGYFAH